MIRTSGDIATRPRWSPLDQVNREDHPAGLLRSVVSQNGTSPHEEGPLPCSLISRLSAFHVLQLYNNHTLHRYTMHMVPETNECGIQPEAIVTRNLGHEILAGAGRPGGQLDGCMGIMKLIYPV